MAGVLKKTTGLTGLAVSKNPHRALQIVYGKLLRALNQLPPDYIYRKTTEKLVKERVEALKTTSDVTALEQKIGCGQAEELIVQAEKELNLARKMAEWKPWEPLVSSEPPNQWNWPPRN